MQSSSLEIAEVQPVLVFKDKDSANRMQSSSLEIAEVQPVLVFKDKGTTFFKGGLEITGVIQHYFSLIHLRFYTWPRLQHILWYLSILDSLFPWILSQFKQLYPWILSFSFKLFVWIISSLYLCTQKASIMYYPRFIDSYLSEWASRKTHKPLLLRGAHRGKSRDTGRHEESLDLFARKETLERHP